MIKSWLFLGVGLYGAVFLHGGSLRGVCAGLRGDPVEYVNISLKGSFLGTIPGTDGAFLLPVPDSLMKDTLCFFRISCEESLLPLESLGETASVLGIVFQEWVVDIGKVSVVLDRSKIVPLNSTDVRLPGMG